MKNEKTLRLLVQQTAEGEIFWGVTHSSLVDKELLDGCPDAEKRSAAYAFKEVVLQQHPTNFEQIFLQEKRKLLNQKLLLEDHVTTHLMVVGRHIKGKGVELIPNDKVLEGRCYWLSWEYYNAQNYDWKPLYGGNIVMITFDESTPTDTYCHVHSIVEGAEENKVKVQRRRLIEDLVCMAGHVSIGAEISEYRETVTETRTFRNLFFSLNGISLADNLELRYFPEDILGSDFSQGKELSVWINPQNKEDGDEPYIVSCSGVNTDNLEKAPKEAPEQDLIEVVGNIISLNVNKFVMWVAMDNYTWASPVYRRKMDMSTWGPVIRDYLPLGFPATFTLDYNKETGQNRLFFRGLSPGKLLGRVSSEGEARYLGKRVLCEQVEVTPYRRKKNENGFYVTSPGYAGFIADKDAPRTLVEYSKERVFSTEMKIPARVAMYNATVVFNITDVLKDELVRLQNRLGQEEPMKICSICLGTVYLTTEGGYPVSYKCNDDKEEKKMRKNMFRIQKFLILNIHNDKVEVKMTTNFSANLEKMRLSVGSLFNAVNSKRNDNGSWYCFYSEIECRIIPESLHDGESLQDGDTLALVTIDLKQQCLVAIAHHDRFLNGIEQPRQLQTIREICEDVWLCKDEECVALMKTNKRETLLLRHLQNIYGQELPVVVKKLNSNKGTAARCQFSGIACGGDYRRLLSGNSFPLQVPLSEKTPRVLYYDAVMTASADTLKEGPFQWVIPTDRTDEKGAFICERGQMPQGHKGSKKILNEDNRSQLISAFVSDVSLLMVTFDISGKCVTMSHQNQLHIPLNECAPLTEIFTIGSKWVLKKTDEQYEVYNECPNEIMAYTLVKMNTRAKKMRRHLRDWLVRNDDGAVAVAQVEDGEEGDTLLMLFDETIDDVSYVCETDMEKGYEIAVRIVAQTEKQGVICNPINKLTLGKTYEIPFIWWNWSHQRLGIKNFEPFVDAVCMTKLTDDDYNEPESVLLDRRCLIPQCELLKGMDANGEYQMQIAGIQEDGYLLQQNNFTAILPFGEASLMHLSNNIILRTEYFKEHTLLMVSITMSEDKDIPQARWKSLQDRTIERWKNYAMRGESQMMKIHHIGTRNLFLEFEGAYLYINSRLLGMWEGQNLSDYYKPNQIISNLILKWYENKQVFGTAFVPGKEPIHTLPPEINSEHQAVVLKYHPKMDFCYVSFGQGRWAAKVPAEEFSWEPQPINQPPYVIGSTVPIKVTEIDIKNLVITASIKDRLPRPLTGPGAEDAAIHPEYRWFSMKEQTNEGLILLDKKHVPGILPLKDLQTPLESLLPAIKNEGGLWLGVIGIIGRNLHCSQRIMGEALKAEDFQYYKPDGKQTVFVKGNAILVATIIAVKKNKLIVSSGASMGYIPRKECTGQVIIPLDNTFQVGQQIKCVKTKQTSLQFEGSIVQAYPSGMRDLLKNVNIGSQVLVQVESATEERVIARLCHKEGGRIVQQDYMVFIEANEIAYETEKDILEWVEKWRGDYINVECTDIQYDMGYIFCSQKKLRIKGS
ncbi:MAG: hypothetical protein IKH01_06125 [Prevotella sp.]|nr:hypothetical protein [Prevotella sp.]